MKALRAAVLILVLLAAYYAPLRTSAQSQSAAAPADVAKKIENFLRQLYAFGPDVKLLIGTPKESAIPGLLETTVELTAGESHDSAKMYVSKDGKFLFRGEMSDLTKDPLAETRAKLDLKNVPSKGPANSTVTLVEFADFECPVCRQAHDILRDVLHSYPQVRFIFKDYPIEQIHPWARTAALAGRCAYEQNPQAFWKLYDSLYDGQEVISAENAYPKVLDYAGQAGLDQSAFKSCLASSGAASAIDASVANAKLLEVTSTPTLFINGRRLVGADRKLIEQYIQYELSKKSTP